MSAFKKIILYANIQHLTAELTSSDAASSCGFTIFFKFDYDYGLRRSLGQSRLKRRRGISGKVIEQSFDIRGFARAKVWECSFLQ